MNRRDNPNPELFLLGQAMRKRKVVDPPIEGPVLPTGILERPKNLYRFHAYCVRDGKREHFCTFAN